MFNTVPYGAGVNPRKQPGLAAPPARRESSTLSADDWALAALHAWGQGGFRALAVEPLAQTLGVTKGSFYWHFQSRDELIKRSMEMWERLGTDEVIARLAQVPDSRERLRALFREAWDKLELLRIEAAIGATALTFEPTVAPIYERVLRKRLHFITLLYRKLGYSAPNAKRHAIAAYGAFLGSVQIALMGDSSLSTEKQLQKQEAVFEKLFLPPALR